jgi:hypothetical protein
MRVFENRVLRRIVGPKRDDVTGKWRKLHNEELHNFTHPQISLGKSITANVVGRASANGRREKSV